MRGKWAFITGASRGIGFLSAVFMAQQGCNLILHSRKKANCDAILNEVTALGVKAYVVEYFKDYGFTITVLGLKEGISFENPEIQKAIDAKFASEQELVIQQNKNQANLAKAEAEAEAMKIAADAKAEALKIAAEAEAETMAANYDISKEEFLKHFGGLETVKYDIKMRKALEILSGEEVK